MDHDPLSGTLFRHAVELNAAAGRLLDTSELRHRRLLANRISDGAMAVTGSLQSAAGIEHSDFLSQLRRAASLRAAVRSIEELERLVATAEEIGYAAPYQVAPVRERLAAIRGVIAALDASQPSERREAA
jgi:hypothetical protein